MKKSFYVFVITIMLSCVAYSQSKCPFGGKVNCEGACGMFVDNNGDGFCDNGIVKKATNDVSKEDKQVKKENVETKSKQQKTVSTKAKQQKDENKTDADQENNAEQSVTTSIAETQTETISNATNNNYIFKKPYHLITITLITLLLYVFTAILVKTNTIKKVTHRKIWNIILLITCLVSCLLGMFLGIVRNYQIEMNSLGILKLHVDVGIAMTIIAIIHIFWHIKYFKNIFIRVKK